MIINIDFNSEEAIYLQLRNQIILGIATAQLTMGESLPSVRQMAEYVGVNMHTVNKAYAVLKNEGYIKLDRRRGAVIDVCIDKIYASDRLIEDLKMVVAEAVCCGISRNKIHEIVDLLYNRYSERGEF